MNGVAKIKHKKSKPEHEYIIKIKDEASGLEAIVAVHSTVLGNAHGGTRMKEYGSEADALDDALNLSRAMSYKSALAGLPYGGAKGVIIAPADMQKRDQVLINYAKKIDGLGGLFHTGTDVGLTDSDTLMMSKFSSRIIGLPKRGNSEWSTSNAAARGVYYAIMAAMLHENARSNLDGVKVAVKGVGKLGSRLVDLLVDGGAEVTIADVDSSRTRSILSKHPGVKSVAADVIHKQTVDVYAPCALGAEFNDHTVGDLDCKFIIGGANNQLENDNAGDELHERGIVYVPDYVANAGGLIFVCEDLEDDGFNPDRVEKRLKNIQNTVEEIMKVAKETNLPTHRVADKLAQERIFSKGRK